MFLCISLSRKQILNKTARYLWIIVIFLFLGAPVLTSCGSKKPRVVTTKKRQESVGKSSRRTRPFVSRTTEKSQTSYEDAVSNETATSEDIAIATARTYLGTKWKYAGNSKRGMDCSGLICTSYKAAGIEVPRTTWSLKEATDEIKIDDVAKGDLLFFATGRNKRRLNHVGLVVNVTPAEILFIHASTSKGVIISSLNQPFWLGSYLSAGRLAGI